MGKTEGMPASKLAALATLYRVSLDDIWFGERRPTQPPGDRRQEEANGG